MGAYGILYSVDKWLEKVRKSDIMNMYKGSESAWQKTHMI